MTDHAAKDAWARIEALGGHGVWESDMVVVSLSSTGITDDDLSLFRDFPYVQILNLSSNPLTDKALEHLAGLRELESLVVIDTQMTEGGLAAFRASHSGVEVRSEPLPPDTINPFTGEPIGE